MILSMAIKSGKNKIMPVMSMARAGACIIMAGAVLCCSGCGGRQTAQNAVQNTVQTTIQNTIQNTIQTGEKQETGTESDAGYEGLDTDSLMDSKLTSYDEDMDRVAKTRKQPEDLYDYEIEENDAGERYVVIRGLQGSLDEELADELKMITQSGYFFTIPDRLEDTPVTEIAPYAFENIELGNYWKALSLPYGVSSVGEGCFEGCGILNVVLDKKPDNGHSAERKFFAGDRAFADNPDLWGIYFADAEVLLGRDVFADCDAKVYLCYKSCKGDKVKEAGQNIKNEEHLLLYAEQNGFEAVEIPDFHSNRPLIFYGEKPLILIPEVKTFFYVESADDELFCSFLYDDDAADYGFPEWHIPCGEFCAMSDVKYEISASSELSSENEKYAAQNLTGYYPGRETAWAEGTPGYGIGESIRITSSCSYQYEWDGSIFFYEGDIEPDIFDGYMRYTEICVVNGYAKNEKLWEENGRVKRLLMNVEGQPYAYLELEDTLYPQYFTLPINDIKAADSVDVHFEFVIEDVYPGTKYEDTCLTGLVIEFMGRRGH